MTRVEVETFLRAHGWDSKPIYPHIFYKRDGAGEVRYKLTDLGVRRESRIPSGEWIRIRSAYYKNLSVTLDDKLAGMSFRGM